MRDNTIRAVGSGAPAGANDCGVRDLKNATQRGASGPDVNFPQGEYCGADGGDHDWVVAYWIGGERDENGEHTICRKCRQEYAP